MIQLFSNRLTKPFMFGTNSKSYLCSMLGNMFEMEDDKKAGTICFIIYAYIVLTLKNANCQRKRYNFTFLKMMHIIYINRGNDILFIHIIGNHMTKLKIRKLFE